MNHQDRDKALKEYIDNFSAVCILALDDFQSYLLLFDLDSNPLYRFLEKSISSEIRINQINGITFELQADFIDQDFKAMKPSIVNQIQEKYLNNNICAIWKQGKMHLEYIKSKIDPESKLVGIFINSVDELCAKLTEKERFLVNSFEVSLREESK